MGWRTVSMRVCLGCHHRRAGAVFPMSSPPPMLAAKCESARLGELCGSTLLTLLGPLPTQLSKSGRPFSVSSQPCVNCTISGKAMGVRGPRQAVTGLVC